MDDRLPSLTALAVAFARAAYNAAPGELHVVSDPLAARLLPWGLSHAARAMPAAWRLPRVTRGALHFFGAGFAEHVALRTAAVDAVVADAFSRGMPQLVILGAGLDARAFRMDALANAVVFEVDHPATQAYKRRHVRGLSPRSHDLRFVTVDFERDDPAMRLAASGHDAAAATFWLWEGVTPYLHHEAIEATLAMIRARSAPGSIVALSYITPGMIGFVPGSDSVLRHGAVIIREPVHGEIETAALHAMLERHGFAVTEDSDTRDWARRFWPEHLARGISVRERLLVAKVRESYTPSL